MLVNPIGEKKGRAECSFETRKGTSKFPAPCSEATEPHRKQMIEAHKKQMEG